MAALFPKNLDEFRTYLQDLDDMVAQDLNDLLDVAVAIEGELGVKPSGLAGTVSARLFQLGNLGVNGWWGLQWRADHMSPCGAFSRRSDLGFVITVMPNRHDGTESVWGERVPAAFGALQWPTTDNSGATGRGSRPWRTCLSIVTEALVGWVGVDGDGQEITPTDAEGAMFGYVIWSLRC